nr:hypothetical protein CFP56_12402 [Quercus suber]
MLQKSLASLQSPIIGDASGLLSELKDAHGWWRQIMGMSSYGSWLLVKSFRAVLTSGIEVKLQRNALSVIEAPTGNEEDDDLEFEHVPWNGSDIGEFG